MRQAPAVIHSRDRTPIGATAMVGSVKVVFHRIGASNGEMIGRLAKGGLAIVTAA